MEAVVYIGHGSRTKEGNQQFIDFIKDIMLAVDAPIQTFGFLELEIPSIASAIEDCVNQGATDVVIMPIFLSSGVHVTFDIPTEIKRNKKRFPNVSFTYGQSIGVDNRVSEILQQRLEEKGFSNKRDECILLVGHGSRVLKAASELEELASLLKSGRELPIKTCFLKTNFPLYTDLLASDWTLSYKKVYILPHLLLTGGFTVKMEQLSQTMNDKFNGIEFILCDSTGFDEKLKELVITRLVEMKEPVYLDGTGQVV